jgi:transposase-like protein
MGVQPYKKKNRDAQKALIINMYKEGNSFRDIGLALKMSHETARKIFNNVTVDKIA